MSDMIFWLFLILLPMLRYCYSGLRPPLPMLGQSSRNVNWKFLCSYCWCDSVARRFSHGSGRHCGLWMTGAVTRHSQSYINSRRSTQNISPYSNRWYAADCPLGEVCLLLLSLRNGILGGRRRMWNNGLLSSKETGGFESYWCYVACQLRLFPFLFFPYAISNA